MKKALTVLLCILIICAVLPVRNAQAAGITQVSTLQELVNACAIDGNSILLKSDISALSSGFLANISGDGVTIDLGGHTIRNTQRDNLSGQSGVFTVSGSDITVKNGTVEGSSIRSYAFNIAQSAGNMTIDNVSTAGTFGCFASMNTSQRSYLYIKNSNIETDIKADISTIYCREENALVLNNVSILNGGNDLGEISNEKYSLYPIIDLQDDARLTMINANLQKRVQGRIIMCYTDRVVKYGEFVHSSANMKLDGTAVTLSSVLSHSSGSDFYSADGDSLTVSSSKNPILEVKASITPPRAGAAADYYPVLPSGVHYQCEDNTGLFFENGVVWQVKSGSSWAEIYPGDTFEAGKSYRVFIYFDAQSGYMFPEGIPTELNGTEPYEFFSGGTKETFRILHEFPVVASTPVITTQPTAKTVAAGSTVTFKVVATGADSYQWQYSDDGSTWKNCSSTGYNNATFSFKASTSLHNRQYRCKVTNSAGTTTSSAAKLTVVGIKTQPTNQTVAVGAQATFKVVATGAASYQWQYSDNGTTWKNCSSSGYNTATFSFKASTTLNNRQYRCQIKNGSIAVTSNAGKLTVTTAAKPTITTQPTNQSVTAGSKATFKVVATGATSYQWQYSTNGTTWTNCKSTGYNTATFAFTASASLNGRIYRCVVSNSAGSVNSSNAKLTVTAAAAKPTITTQPTNKTVASGTSVTFKVVATGATSYQWQYSADNGKTWKNCSSTGYNTATFSFKASAALNGRMYRCVVKNSAGSATSSGAKLTVSNVKPTITVQPTNKTATAGTKVSFSVIAAGSGLKYQWQWSADGTTLKNCTSTGYNTATFTFTASASLNNRQYRCVVSNSYGSVPSSAGKLTVK